jgi:toxin-antitoxin system PIN domain toxin
VIALDTNVLVYAHRRDSKFHALAFEVVEELAQGGVPWAIPWPCLHELYAIITHRRIFQPPSSRSQARKQIDAWLKSPTLQLLSEAGDHWSVLRRLVDDGKIEGPMVHDARVAAICLANGVTELWTADRDFTRFPQLSTRNPLVG